ncbi:MAG: pentapeptide repeat-containing protein, partial [Moorea sp. SIO3E2]|nr:pentapeptide repeat-containing protein [Moorena sp. SIO3E2]
MTEFSQGNKTKKLTIAASSKGVETAKKALEKLEFELKSNFPKSQGISHHKVTKFLKSEPIQLDLFKRICEGLTLDWKEIAGIVEEKSSEQLNKTDGSSSEPVQGVEQSQTLTHQETIIERQSQTIKAVLVLEGDINSVQPSKLIESILQQSSGYTINIIDIKPSRLILEGFQEAIEGLEARIKSEDLKELSGFPVKDIQILNESSDDEDNSKLDHKWRLVAEIASGGAVGRDLRGANLSDADLSDTKLSGANLCDADLSGADLSGADLSGADFNDANLSGADLSSANLIRANLIRANLSGANITEVSTTQVQ